ncbi:hypothetical protein BJN45_14510 [Azonexus hydrophilus]|uniref:ClbS/DfsB family four-helix bundle protein n=1 Tax=Azonexus hydrophilus TaxID=418702 RepID=A0A1R1I161_9RHOO|nr:ClbS/DfsB family four-helix bundle protein [Azonexus hydrophilus]OMG52502.1 hypothetical protein BJN45_14510 [Azonexus hydrophilus]
MPLPTNKHQLLSSLQAAYSKLIEEAAEVPSELERNPELEGGISPCDLIAYQIGWGRLLLSWDDLETNGQTVEMPAPGFKWNQLGLLAKSFYQEQNEQTLKQLLAQFETLEERMRLFIESSSEDTIFSIGKRHWAGRACKNFCVNGHPAGNCHIARSDDDRRKESSTEGVAGQPVG